MEDKKAKVDIREMVAQGLPMKRRESETNPLPEPVEPENIPVADAPRPVERTKRKSAPKGDYESLFLEPKEFKDRRAVYISKAKHQEVAYILKTIDGGELSVGAFVENIINHHLETYRDEIDTLFELKCQKPSQRFGK